MPDTSGLANNRNEATSQDFILSLQKPFYAVHEIGDPPPYSQPRYGGCSREGGARRDRPKQLLALLFGLRLACPRTRVKVPTIWHGLLSALACESPRPSSSLIRWM